MILQQKIKEEFGNKYIEKIEIPKSILNNIKYPLREYQKEALQYFILYTNEYVNIENQNKHLMFNMATGSGKTLIMASLILYLYEKGYRNFIFCVSLTNIIEKTKNNFFDYNGNKYLFKPNIKINNIDVNIKESFYFDDDKYNINIFITTIQSLHSMFNEERENALTFEDLKDKEIVILADEAHHFNSETSKATSYSQSVMFDDENNYTPKTKSASWENTIKAILNLNKNNYLLEFTATLDYNNINIKEKYEDKIIYKYDLIHFRKDLYSKEINILQNDVDNKYLMLGAVILSEYRREIANDNKINIKPVILFKSDKLVKKSFENQVIFNELIDNLTIKDIEMLEKSDEDNNDILNKAIKYFKNKYKNFDDFIIRIKEEFKIENQLTTNFDEEKKTKNKGNEYEENIKKMTVKEKKQLLLENKLLNTLENDDNPIRAIFSVNKLNEGWDVLNLFDIVRLYNFRDADYKKNKQGKSIFGKTTISEAQLIGRGARYYPIKLDIDGNDERTYKRKYDNDLNNDKRILETLYYHSTKNSKYIYEIKEALRDLGLMEQETYDNKEFMLKYELKSFAKNNYIFSNSLEEKIKIYNGEKTFFGYKKTFDEVVELLHKEEFKHECKTFSRKYEKVEMEKNSNYEPIESMGKITPVTLKEIPMHIKLYSWYKQNYSFSDLTIEINSIVDLLNNINIWNIPFKFYNLTKENKDKEYELFLTETFFPKFINIIKTTSNEYYGSKTFKAITIDKAFPKKIKKVYHKDIKDKFEDMKKIKYYAQNFLYSDSRLEIDFAVNTMNDVVSYLEDKGYTNIYLIRNDQDLAIYNFDDGKAFYPDFILICNKNNKTINYQVFLEAKGGHIKDNPEEKRKEEFLISLKNSISLNPKDIFELNTNEYKIIGMPFFTNIDNTSDWIKCFKEEIN